MPGTLGATTTTSGFRPDGVAAVLAYGALALPLAFAALPLYVHVPRLYGEVLGLGLAVVGVVLLAARLLDALVDPLIGLWSDRLRARRTLIAVALPLLAGGVFGLLRPPAGLAGEAAVLWLLASLTAATAGFSVVSIAYQAWAAEIGTNSDWRTRLVASREGFTIAGVVLASLLPGLLADDFATGLARMAALFVPLLFIAAALTLVAGGPAAGVAATLEPPRWSRLAMALHDPLFRRLLAVFVCNGIAAALPATLVLFYVSDVLRAEAWSGAFLAVYFAAGVAGLPLWLALARRHGRVRAWLAAMALALAGFALAPFLGAGQIAAFFVVCLFSGLALGADLAIPGAMLADAAAASSRAHGEANNGAYMGWWNLVAKLNLALAAGIALPLLQGLGYQPGSSAGVAALALAYGALPMLFKGAAALLLWRWRNQLEVTK